MPDTDWREKTHNFIVPAILLAGLALLYAVLTIAEHAAKGHCGF